MFTLKKYALLGAAGLAALAMSCSDTDDETGSADITGFSVTDGATAVTLGGVITAATGLTVDGLGITAVSGSKTQVITFVTGQTPTYGVNSVDLAGKQVKGFCDGLTGTQTFTVTIIATISDATTGKATANATIACGGATEPTGGWAFTLAAAGTSYADVDGSKTFTRDNAMSAANVETIDLIAFDGTGNLIMTPFDLDTFYDENDDLIGDGSIIWEVPAANQAQAYTAITTATTAADQAALATMVDQVMVDANEVDGGLTIAAQKVFIVETTEVDVYAVVITEATLTGSKSAKLRAYFVK